MMQQSNNRYTRALELRYGRDNLAAFASSLGMSNTNFVQIFGCAVDGGQKNVWNLVDAGKLYEAIASGVAVPAVARNQLLSMMPSGDVNYIKAVQSEAASLGIPSAYFDFLQDSEAYYKPGSYDICSGRCGSSNIIVIRDAAGMLTLPLQTPKGTVETFYVWGSFIDNLTTSCQSDLTCPTGDIAYDAVKGALPELFRPAIHAALATWLSVTTVSVRPGIYAGGKLRLSAVLRRRYVNKSLGGQKVGFTMGGHALCTAVTTSAGLASCFARAPKVSGRTYSARFAGGSGLFPSSGLGRLPPRKAKK